MKETYLKERKFLLKTIASEKIFFQRISYSNHNQIKLVMSQYSTPNSTKFSEDCNEQCSKIEHFKDVKWDCIGCKGGFLKVFGIVTGRNLSTGKDIRTPMYVTCSNKVPENAKVQDGDEVCIQKMMFSKFHSTCSYCLKGIAVKQFITLVPGSEKTWVHSYCLHNKTASSVTVSEENGPELCLRCENEISGREDKHAVPARYKLQTGRIHKECVPKKDLSKRKFDGI